LRLTYALVRKPIGLADSPYTLLQVGVYLILSPSSINLSLVLTLRSYSFHSGCCRRVSNPYTMSSL